MVDFLAGGFVGFMLAQTTTRTTLLNYALGLWTKYNVK